MMLSEKKHTVPKAEEEAAWKKKIPQKKHKLKRQRNSAKRKCEQKFKTKKPTLKFIKHKISYSLKYASMISL